jgi:hypothetical protein
MGPARQESGVALKVVDETVEIGSAAERRSSRRVKTTLRVLLREDRFATSGRTIDVGTHGALVQTSAPLRLRAVYDLYVQRHVHVHHSTVRVLRELPGYVYALRFDEALSLSTLEDLEESALAERDH